MLFWVTLGLALAAATVFGIHSYNSGWGGVGNAIGVFFASLFLSSGVGFAIWGGIVLLQFDGLPTVQVSSSEYSLDKDSKFNVNGRVVSFVGTQNGTKEAINFKAEVVQVLNTNPTKVKIVVFDIVDDRLSPWPLDTQSNVIIK
jgi:hypothetical protein